MRRGFDLSGKTILFFWMIIGVVVVAEAQVGIGTKTPDESAQLEVTVPENQVTKRGVLIPRVALVSTNSMDPMENSGDLPNSLLVFNTAMVGDVTPGFYYWYDGNWVALSSESGAMVTNVSLTTDGSMLILTDSRGEQVDIPLSDISYTPISETAPVPGAAGDTYFNTSEGIIYISNGSNWIAGSNGSVVTVEDNLTSSSTTNALSANQGRILNEQSASKLDSSLVSGHVFVGNADGKAVGVALSGDATIDNTGALTIGDDAVTTSKLIDGAVTAAKLNQMGATDGQVIKWNNTSSVWEASSISNLTVEDNLTSSSTTNALSANQGRTLNEQSASKLDSSLVSGHIFVGNADGKAAGVALSGDATIDNTGALTIGDDAVTNSKLADNAVNTAEIVDDAVTTSKLIDGAVTATKLNQMGATDGQVIKWNNTSSVWEATNDSEVTVEDNLTSSSTTNALSANQGRILNEQSASKLDSSLVSGNIFVGNVDGKAAGVALSGDATIDNTGALTIGDDAVTNSKLADNAVNTAEIVDDAVTTSKLIDGAVTAAKLNQMGATDGQVIKWNNTSSVWEASSISNLTVEDNLTSSSTTNALSANQGRILNEQSASKLDSSLVSGHVFVGNADGKAVGVALSGDATIDNTGALTIGDDAVTTSKLMDGAVTAAKLNQMGATDGQVIKWNNTSGIWEATNDSEVTVEDNLTSSSTTNALSANQGRILNEQSASKLDSSLVSGHVFVGNADGKAVGVALSGDATIDNTGALTIGDDAVTTSKLMDGAVTAAKLNQMGATDGQVIKWNNTSGIWEATNDSEVTVEDNLTSSSTTNALSANQGRILNEQSASKLDSSLVSGNIFVGNANGKAVGVALSGDATIDNTGALTIGDDAVTTSKLIDGAVTAAKLNQMGATDGQVIKWNNTSSVWEATNDNEVTVEDNLTSSSTTNALSANQGRILNEQSASKLDSSLVSGHVFVGNADGKAVGVALSGDATIDNTGVLTIGDDAVTNSKLIDGAVTATKLNQMGATDGQVIKWNNTSSVWEATNDSEVTVEDNLTSSSTTNALSANQGRILNEQSASKLDSSLVSGNIFVGNVDGKAAGVALSGDATIDNTGALTIGDDAVTTSKLMDGAVTAAKLNQMGATDGQVIKWNNTSGIWEATNDSEVTVEDNLTSSSTTNALSANQGRILNEQSASKLDSSLVSGNIFVGNANGKAVGVALSGDATIDNTGALTIGDDAVTTSKLIDGAVTAAKLNQMGATDGQVIKWNNTSSVWEATNDNEVTVEDNLTSSSTTNALSANQGRILNEQSASKLDSSLVSGHVFVGNADGKAVGVALSGDATIDNTGVLTIGDDAVTNSKLIDGAVTATKLNQMGATDGQVIKWNNTSSVWEATNDSEVTVEDNLTSSSTTNALSANQGRILNEQSASKLDSSLVSGNIFVGNVDGKAAGVALSGDATIDNTGALTIGDDAVTNSKLADNAVNTAEIVDDAVTTSKLIDGAVTAAKLNQMGATDGQVIKWNNTSSVWEATNDSEVTVEDNLTSSSTTNALSANQGRILNEQSASKLDSSLVSGNIFVGNADGKAVGVALSGDATIDNTGALTIGDDAVTNSKLADNAVNTAEIVDDAVTTSKLIDGAVTAAKLNQMGATDGQVIKWNNTSSVWEATNDSEVTVEDNLTSSSTTNALSANQGRILNEQSASKLDSSLVSGNIFVGNADGKAVGVALSGDATIDNTGALTIGDDAVTNSKLADNAVNTAEIVDDAVTTSKLIDGAVTAAKLNQMGATDGQVIKWNNTSSVWEATNDNEVTVEDNLTSSSTTNALSANQGRILKEQSASKLDSSLVSGNIFVGNVDGKAVGVALSGDATIDNTGALTIGDDAVTNSKLIDGAVTAAKLNQMGATDGQVIKWNNTSSVWEATNDSEVTVEDNLTSSSTTNALSANQGRILNEQSASKLDSTLTTGHIFVGNSDGKAEDNSSIFVDAAGLVGVGIATPITELTVKDTNTGNESSDVLVLSPASDVDGWALSSFSDGTVAIRQHTSSGFSTNASPGVNTIVHPGGFSIEPDHGHSGGMIRTHGASLFTNDGGFITQMNSDNLTSDFIRHDDSSNEWHFGSDRNYTQAGNSTLRASAFNTTSDRRLKENIASLDASLDKILGLKPVSYNMIDNTEQTQLGLIAQEVLEHFPEVVHQGSDGYYSLNYSGLVAPMISAIQELEARNEELRAENEDLRDRIKFVENLLTTINARVDAMEQK